MRIFNAFRELENMGGANVEDAFRRHLVTESERFALWAQSLGLGRQGHASLDYRVRDASVVKDRLEDLLDGLATHLNELRSIVAGERQPLNREHGEEDNYSISSSQDAGGDSDSSTAQAASSASSECPSSSGSFYEIDFRQQSITEAIDALYSLATKMRNPRNRPQRTIQELYKHIPPERRRQYIQEREDMEVMIISHIQSQSLSEVLKQSGGSGESPDSAGEPSASADTANAPIGADHIKPYALPSNFLVRRIGIANARRKQQFVYWKEHAARIRGSPATHNANQLTNPERKEALLEGVHEVLRSQIVSRVAPSSAPHQSLATSATRQDNGAFTHAHDLQSVISRHSRVSTVFTAKGTKLEWPPPPAHLAGDRPKFFTCPYCQLICPGGYLAKDAWR